MQVKKITAPTGTKWISKIKELNGEIPVNCLFDKGITGCGGTELALKNSKNTIIAVPYVSLIENKESQHGNKVIGVYGGILQSEIEQKILANETKKIMVTYNSLPRVITTLKALGYNPYQDFFLLVDEWHVLFNSYSFRRTAVKEILEEAPKFKEVTYMTATPIEEKYLFDEFKHLPVVEIEWPNSKKLQVISQPTNNPLKSICKEIEKARQGQILGNLHIFVNSVDFIASVIKRLNLLPEQVKIVCSNNANPGRGVKSNQKKLGKEYKIEKPLDSVKKINFYTSTCFEGCDIYDSKGRVYIVSDGNKRHTQIDISTLLIQICGRIRDCEYDKITHIFSYTRYASNVSLKEFEEKTLKDYYSSEKMINNINQMDTEERKKVIGGFSEYYCNSNYITTVDDRLFLDKNLLNLDIINFKIATGVYSSRMAYIEELKKNNIEEGYNKYDYYEATDILERNKKARIPFRKQFDDYIKLQANKSGFGLLNEQINMIDKERPIVGKAFRELGVARVKELKYHTGNIKNELIKLSDMPQANKIQKMLIDKIGLNKPIEISLVKEIIQSIYDVLDIKIAVKSTLLNKFFHTKCIVKKKDGRSTRYIEIIREKSISIIT